MASVRVRSGLEASFISSIVRVAVGVVLVGAWLHPSKLRTLRRTIMRLLRRQLPANIRNKVDHQIHDYRDRLELLETQLAENYRVLQATKNFFTDQWNFIWERHARAKTDHEDVSAFICHGSRPSVLLTRSAPAFLQLRRDLSLLASELGSPCCNGPCLGATHGAPSIEYQVEEPGTRGEEILSARGAECATSTNVAHVGTEQLRSQSLVEDLVLNNKKANDELGGPSAEGRTLDELLKLSNKTRQDFKRQSLEDLAIEFASLARQLRHKGAHAQGLTLCTNSKSAETSHLERKSI